MNSSKSLNLTFVNSELEIESSDGFLQNYQDSCSESSINFINSSFKGATKSMFDTGMTGNILLENVVFEVCIEDHLVYQVDILLGCPMNFELKFLNVSFQNLKNCSVWINIAFEDDIDTPSQNFDLKFDEIMIKNSSINSGFISFDINSKFYSP